MLSIPIKDLLKHRRMAVTAIYKAGSDTTLALSLVAAGAALANGGPERPWQVLGSGLSDSVATRLSLRATLGQPLMGVVTGSGGVSPGARLLARRQPPGSRV